MADDEHVWRLTQGKDAWNCWRTDNPTIEPDLSAEILFEANLAGFDLSFCNLSASILAKADLRFTNLANADLRNANLLETRMNETYAGEVDLFGANLSGANLTGANLSQASLICSVLVRADLTDADIGGSRVYGVSAWDANLTRLHQNGLIISRPGEAIENTVTVDNLQLAQFIHLLLHNPHIRDVIDTVTSKVVLILGRFSAERKAILDTIRDTLRHVNLVPVLFDFEKPDAKDITGTVETLARMARFIIVDLTDASSVPHELATIVPFLRTTPVLPIRLAGSRGYSMFEDMRAYPWVLRPHKYENCESLVAALPALIAPVMERAERYRNEQQEDRLE